MFAGGVVFGMGDLPISRKTGSATSGRYRFPKADRLLQRTEFVFLSHHGKKLQNRYFIAFIDKGKTPRSRLGITVTKKVGHAATRNRIKRIIREYFRLNRQRLTTFWDINIIVKRQANTVPNTTLFLSLDNLFERMAALYDE